MMSDRYDVIVIGVGAMGSAACWQLARRGARVLGLDRFDIPNVQGSSHGLSRMIRMAYYEHADYVPLLRRSFEIWRELESESGQSLLHVVGGLYMGPEMSGLINGSLKAAKVHQLDHEFLGSRQLSERYPQFRLPADHVGFYEPAAGFLQPEDCVAAFARGAIRRGAELHGHEPVESWSADATGARVQTSRREYRASRLVFSGGPWSGALLEPLRIKLRVTRQVMGWFSPPDPKPFEFGRMPVWAIDQPDGSLYYGFPIHSPGLGMKVAHHRPGTPADPDHVDRDIHAADEQPLASFLRQFMPQADGPAVAFRTCLYTNSPDSHFIIDRHPQFEHVYLACGFSGHGFKFAGVVGEVLADLALDGKTDLPIGFLSLGRFA
jgi:sarcosine oxidase